MSSRKRGGLVGVVEASGTPAVKKGIENILDELGITGRQTAFTQRTLALSDPAKYAHDREGRFKELTNRVAKTYEKVREELSKSGLPINEVLRLSSQAAENVYMYDTENAILETQFPSGSNDAAGCREKILPWHDRPSGPRTGKAPRKAPRDKEEEIDCFDAPFLCA